MRSLRFQEILLLSRRERSARSVLLDRDLTIVLGKNDTGKSALLKSIYGVFGATAAIVHPRWRTAEVIGAVRFTVDDVPFTILRSESFYAVFDRTDQLLITTDKVLTGLGPFLAELLDYKIVLTTARTNQPVPPPPQYFFLPFYIDQDVGWTANWSSFAHLSQIRDWRRSMAEFHTGIRPNEYYVAKAALAVGQNLLRQARSEVIVLDRMLADVRQEVTPTFDMDLEGFQAVVKQLLEECNNLRKVEEELSGKLSELYNRRHTLHAQLGVASAALKEVSGDYRFATEEVTTAEVECPTCGAVYANSFAERFEIAQDEDRISELILHLRDELAAVDRDIERLAAQHSNSRAESQRINTLLEQRQGEITMRSLIQSEGKKEINILIRDKMATARSRVTDEDAKVTQLRLRVKEFDQPDRQNQILEQYHSLMRLYLHELNVVTLREATYQQISSRISETGSDLPRALLAYYFSILNVMAERSTSSFCPIVIDSPNQQGQDPESLASVLRFIRDRRPRTSQMILAMEEPSGVEFDGRVIELADKYHLLREDQYARVSAIITALLTRALNS